MIQIQISVKQTIYKLRFDLPRRFYSTFTTRSDARGLTSFSVLSHQTPKVNSSASVFLHPA